MSTQSKTELSIRKRIDEISQLLYELAAGNFDYKLQVTDFETELEGLIGGIHMLGEELKTSTVSKDFMESVYRGVVDIMFILTPDLKIERANKPAQKMLGYTYKEFEGKPFEKIISGSKANFLREVKDELSKKMVLDKVEINLKPKNGNPFPVSAAFSILYDNKKNFLGVLFIAKDISLLKDSEKQMQDAKERAESASEAKSSFLANMSHEIRTPLNGILGFVDLLIEDSPTKKQLKYLKMIKISGESLSRLLNDILDLNRVEQGKLNLEMIDFHFAEAIRSNLNPHIYTAKEQGLVFELTFDPSIPKIVVGDPSRINQITRNLIVNALKFTREGFIKAAFSATPVSDTEVIITGKITDTGIGISSEKHDSIFESFTQADNSTSRKYGGSGLGLTITRHLIELMGGSIQLESPARSEGLERGCKFTFTIKLGIGEENITEEAVREGSKVKFDKPYEVLIVDDNEINLLLAKKVLESMNASVRVATDGQEAIEMTVKHQFDIILMDVQMPVMDGYVATKKLRKKGYDGLIIALSANAYKEYIEKCFESGMDGHVRKPFTKKDIYDAIIENLGKRTPAS